MSENEHAPGRHDHPLLAAVLERLIESRVAAGLSQAQAATLMRLGGNKFISVIETGEQRLTLGMFLNLCDAYDVHPVWVLTGVNPDFDPSPVVKLLGEDFPDLDRILRTLTMTQRADPQQGGE